MKRSMVVLGLVGLVILAASPRTARAQSLQEVLLRAKPAVALVVSEVAAHVTVNCGGVVTTVEPERLARDERPRRLPSSAPPGLAQRRDGEERDAPRLSGDRRQAGAVDLRRALERHPHAGDDCEV